MIPEYLKRNLDLFRIGEYTIVPDENEVIPSADKFVFIKHSKDEKWQLHILEFKKSIKYDKWKKIKNQFKFGIMNARALAAFLNMEIDTIILETAYRNEWKLRNEPYSPTVMRAANSATEVAAYKEWQGNIVILELDSEEICFCHEKIKLDYDGNGEKIFKLLDICPFET